MVLEDEMADVTKMKGTKMIKLVIWWYIQKFFGFDGSEIKFNTIYVRIACWFVVEKLMVKVFGRRNEPLPCMRIWNEMVYKKDKIVESN